MLETYKLVYTITTFIPKGKVLTYKELARLSGVKNPRVVGNILHKNEEPRNVPCHRVVTSVGAVADKYAFGGGKVQAERLNKEGIEVIGGGLNLKKFLWRPSKALRLYFRLLKEYGDPGYWPWYGNVPFDGKQAPHTPEQIAVGAILTQNTAWRNVEYALENLRGQNVLSIKAIYRLGQKDMDKLKQLIRPSGYYNQKARRLFEFCKFIVEDCGTLMSFFESPLPQVRDQLLLLSGIGKETADSIILYAGSQPVFVIDAYTKRFVKANRLSRSLDYDSLQNYFERNLPRNLDLFQKYHALIIKWGKENKI